jgi:UDP-N-acetylmuramate dehydrogenase
VITPGPAGQRDVPLAELTTLRLGGLARRLITCGTADELVDVVRRLDARREPLLLLGGGSNLVISDDGFDGTVVQIGTGGVRVADGPEGTVDVTVAAGADWDGFVGATVAAGQAGVEALSGIPGLTGAAPVQNIGAYGQDVSQTIVDVRALDRRTGEVVRLRGQDCGFGYRDSRFKSTQDWVVLAVTFRLVPGGLGAPVRYAELGRTLGVQIGEQVPLADVRAAVLDLRRGKGMVLDPSDHDTWSAGSFFTNPILAPALAERLPADAPRWPEADGRVKTSAAWLIERSGFGKGYGDGPVRVSSRHTLALTNRGGAKTADLLALAGEIRAGVRKRFGIELVNEPVLVGCSL